MTANTLIELYSKDKNKEYLMMGRVQRKALNGKNKESVCLENIRLKGSDSIIAQHCWNSKYTSNATEVVDAELHNNRLIGKTILFRAIIVKYTKLKDRKDRLKGWKTEYKIVCKKIKKILN